MFESRRPLQKSLAHSKNPAALVPDSRQLTPTRLGSEALPESGFLVYNTALPLEATTRAQPWFIDFDPPAR